MIVEATVSETDGGRSRLIAEAATLNPEERVRLVLLLEDPPFAWYEFRTTLTDEARQSIVAVRVEQLRPAFDALEAKLASLPDADVSEDVRFWISPMLSVSVPAKHISDIVQWSELVSMERDDNKPAAENAAYTGFHVRMDTRDYGIGTAGYTGLHGGLSGSGNVRVAALEAEALFDYNHPAFLWPTSLTHRAIALDCGSGSCSSFTPSYGPSPPNSTHPTAVLGIIAGNIEGGQDPNYPNNVGWAQTMRSGQSRDAYIYMMSSTTGNFQTSTNQVAAQQFALSYGLDIMNHSYQNGVGTNNTSYDNTGLNAAISNAVNGGLLNVFASGNLGPAASTVAYPAVRRDGITVGGLDSSNTTQAYNTLGIYTGSDAASIGPMYATIAGTTYSSLSGVDVVAPEYLEDLATVGISPVDTYSTCCAHGTSFAAPIVAGGAALAQNALYSNGYVFTGRLLQTYLFLMNDGWQNAAGVATSNGMDPSSGGGRFLNHSPTTADLGPGSHPWGFGCHTAALSQGQSVTYPVWATGYVIPSNVTMWKVAMTWAETGGGTSGYYNNMADLDVAVYSTCTGSSGVFVDGDSSRDIRSRVRLAQGTITGQCLQYTVSAFYVPPGQTRTFTACDYFTSSSASQN